MVWRTTLITLSTCFLLGTTFACWVADHNVLWRTPLTAEAVETSMRFYSLIAGASPWLGWAYMAVGSVAMLSAGGRILKGLRQDRGEIVFDGANVVLLAAIIYTMLTKTYPTITMIPTPLPSKLANHTLYPGLVTTATDLASDNIISAVMLTGIMLLQAGRYYAKRPSPPDDDLVDSDASQPATPPSTDEPASSFSPVAQRAQTPYRELTEAEAMELHDGVQSRRKSKK